MKSLYIMLGVLLVGGALYVVFGMGEKGVRQAPETSPLVALPTQPTEKATGAYDVGAIAQKWQSSLVETTCRFVSSKKTTDGIGFSYTDATHTNGLLIVNSRLMLESIEGVQYSADNCSFISGGRAYSIPYSQDKALIGPGSDWKNGTVVMWDELLHEYDRELPTEADVCLSGANFGDEVVLLGKEGKQVVTSESTVGGVMLDGNGGYLGHALGPKMPARGNLTIAIDAQKNCYLGLVSHDQTHIMAHYKLAEQ